MSLDLIKKPSDSTHEISKLVLRKLRCDEHRNDTWQYLLANFLGTKNLTNLFIGLQHLHTYSWVRLLASKFL